MKYKPRVQNHKLRSELDELRPYLPLLVSTFLHDKRGSTKSAVGSYVDLSTILDRNDGVIRNCG